MYMMLEVYVLLMRYRSALVELAHTSGPSKLKVVPILSIKMKISTNLM